MSRTARRLFCPAKRKQDNSNQHNY